MAENTQHRTPLPDGWCERVRSAMLVVISLAQDACPHRLEAVGREAGDLDTVEGFQHVARRDSSDMHCEDECA